MQYPEYRARRLRANENFRRLARETRLSADNFIMPLFVRHGKGVRAEIASMTGQYQFSPDTLVEKAAALAEAGIPAIVLFGIPAKKDAEGSEACSDEGIVQKSIRAIKKAKANILVIADVCLCEYTDHGHCGIMVDGRVDNDETLKRLAKSAVSFARAGADIIAPSDMMDGRVRAIRSALDAEGFRDTAIMSYAAKFASAFYGPFREAAESPPKMYLEDRATYQMDPANAEEAMREIGLDIDEGADIVMVKPALPCLDIIRRAKDEFEFPLAAYCVSGEYAMIKAAAKNGWLEERKCVMEMMTAIRRAGADMILTYWAEEMARWLKQA
jgi:porphobilinogen synthase